MTMTAGFLVQPQQGRSGARIGVAGGSAYKAANPSVQWRILAGSSVASLGSLQVTLTTTQAGFDNDTDLYSTSVDVTGDMLAAVGNVTYDFDREALSKVTIVVTNRSLSPLRVFMRQTMFGEFAPQRAPAEIEDSEGFGYIGMVEVNSAGTVLARTNVQPVALTQQGKHPLASLTSQQDEDMMYGGGN
jgi:hypothetical protein